MANRIELPIVGAAHPVGRGETRADLIRKINKDHPNEPDIPIPDFADPQAPLRVEIEALLERIDDSIPALVDRNGTREAEVRSYLERNYPGNTVLRDTILADLESYPQWEVEDAEGGA